MKIPFSFCRINGCCYVIVSNSVIGGSFWVDLVWLAALTVRLQVSYCSRMSDYNCTEWLVKNKAANALITFEKIVMVMINSAIFEKQLKALHVVHTFILTWSCLDHDLHLYMMMTYGMRNRRIFIGQAKRCFRDWPFFFTFLVVLSLTCLVTTKILICEDQTIWWMIAIMIILIITLLSVPVGNIKWILSWLANQAGKMGPSCPQCRRGVSKAVKDSQNEEDKRRSWVYCAKTQLAFHPVPQRIRKLFKQFHSKSYNDLVTSLFLQPSSIVY